ncbi:MAG: 4Fe-4S dicluster domain-containing protein, partial [Nitrospiria bacterium]
QPIEKDLRIKAKELLESGEVKVVIGYGWARRQRRTVPVFITDPGEVDQLIFNPLSINNLSIYLLKKHKDIRALGKPAIVAKGCDIRTIVVLLEEAQISREDVVILGMVCNGSAYRQELWKGELSHEILSPKCETCDVKNPHLYDHIIGEKLELSEKKESGSIEEKIKELEGQTAKERWDFWMDHFDRCIKCYACRHVCPLCYCERCITEKNMPQWVETSAHPQGNLSWNLVRAIHLAGRCTSCGECDRVCPLNIPLNLINRKLALVGEEAFDYRSGYDPEVHPPMIVYSPDDQESFTR